MSDHRFELEDAQGWREFLAQEGYVVIAGVLDDEVVAQSLDEMWAIMEALAPVRRDEPATWSRSANWPPMLHGGMIQYIGHSQLQWNLREQCARVYAEYYGVDVEELATSFDGICMMHSARRYKRAGNLTSFLHFDQAPVRRGEWSIQGLVTLTSSGVDEGGLVVVPGTHLEHEEFFEEHHCSGQKTDWYKLEEAEKIDYEDRAIKVDASAGDFLMWDSRTLHANAVPTAPGSVRACVYVCMLPQARLSPAIRQKRAAAFAGRRTSNHHPAEGFKTFPKLPRFVQDRDVFWRRVYELQETTLSSTQRALLAGIDRAQGELGI